MRNSIALFSFLVLFGNLFAACASMQVTDHFEERQRARVTEESTYNQAEFEFSASVMEVRGADIKDLRAAWSDQAGAFPESNAIKSIEREMKGESSRVVLASVFMTEYDKADLKNQALGWTVSPKPEYLQELSESDVVLRTLMPNQNPWARYFLMRYPVAGASAPNGEIIIGNRQAALPLRLK